MLSRPALIRALPFILSTILVGCGSGPRVATTNLHAGYFPSRDGALQYRLPVGWFDATADSQATAHAIWLMRNDYGASITVDEVRLDAAARKEIERGGLLQLAQLVMALTTGEHGAMLLEPPAVVNVNGRLFCRYEMVASATRDTLRVALFDTGGKAYVVTALLPEKAARRDPQFSIVHENFLSTLRW